MNPEVVSDQVEPGFLVLVKVILPSKEPRAFLLLDVSPHRRLGTHRYFLTLHWLTKSGVEHWRYGAGRAHAIVNLFVKPELVDVDQGFVSYVDLL